jgi:hypothetical protein
MVGLLHLNFDLTSPFPRGNFMSGSSFYDEQGETSPLTPPPQEHRGDAAVSSPDSIITTPPPRRSSESDSPADSSLLSTPSGEETDSSPQGVRPSRRPKFQAPDGKVYEKPAESYIAQISMAILSTSDKKMLLSDIYSYLMARYPYYKLSDDKAWRNSIRHNLSLNECFVKNGRADNGKGHYWSVHPACLEDFNKGDFRRRQARRRARRCQAAPYPEQNYSSPRAFTYTDGYVPMSSFQTGFPTSLSPFNPWGPYHPYIPTYCGQYGYQVGAPRQDTQTMTDSYQRSQTPTSNPPSCSYVLPGGSAPTLPPPNVQVTEFGVQSYTGSRYFFQ